MLKSAREKIILRQGLIAIGVMAAIYFLLFSPFFKEGSSILDEELERKTAEINRYITKTGSVPSKDGFEKLEKEKETLEQKLHGLIDHVDPKKARVSDTTSEAGLYFIERLHSSMKKFSEGLSEAAKLPENLGFGDGLPKDNMVETLLRQLETVEFVVESLLKGDKAEFSAIKPLRPIEYIEPLSKELFYTELPVQISIKTHTNSLARLLLELKNSKPLISVKEMHIKSSESESGDIEASLVLSSFMIAKRKEE